MRRLAQAVSAIPVSRTVVARARPISSGGTVAFNFNVGSGPPGGAFPDLTIRADDVVFPSTFNVDGTLTIARSSFGSVGLGDGVGGVLNISAAELAGLTAGSLVVGDPDQATNNIGTLFVGDLDVSASVASTQLNGLNANAGFVLFDGASSFDALEANSADALAVRGDFGGNVTALGDVTLNANIDGVLGPLDPAGGGPADNLVFRGGSLTAGGAIVLTAQSQLIRVVDVNGTGADRVDRRWQHYIC